MNEINSTTGKRKKKTVAPYQYNSSFWGVFLPHATHCYTRTYIRHITGYKTFGILFMSERLHFNSPTCHVKAIADLSRPSASTLMWFTLVEVSALVTLSYWSTSCKSV